MRGPLLALVLALSPALLLVDGCATASPGARLIRPTVKLTRVRAVTADPTGVTVEAVVRIDNPNVFPLLLERVEYQLELDHRVTAHGETTASLTVPPRGTADGPVRLRAPFREALAAGAVLLLMGEIPYTLTMTAYLSTPIRPLAIPLIEEGKLSLRDMVPDEEARP
ncbi:MAG: LEA type 2 family protein [Deltaproteobacteria bacterium]|nr:LEA type 2 family protein [Deltaproteobacteria bacterium]